MRTWQVLLHKILGLFAGFLNIVLAASVLDAPVSYLYLTILSASQVFMAFSAFGLTHKLVTMTHEDAQVQRAAPWFALTFVLGLALFSWLYYDTEADVPIGVIVFSGLLLLLLLLAEWLRAAVARQVGFIIYNVVLLVAAIIIFATRDIPLMLGLLPLAGCGILLWNERRFYRILGITIRPELRDFVRALRVTCVNQYYNLVVLMFPFVGVSVEALSIILVFRFAIFYNWQNFFWLRFGHKQLTQDIDKSHSVQNLKFIKMNIVALAGTIAVLTPTVYFELFRFVPSGAFDAEFAYLLLYFAAVRTLVNLCFPFEVFLLYRSKLRGDLLMLGISLISFALLAFVLQSATNAFLIITIVELVSFSWRLISFWILKNGKTSTSA